MPILKTKMSKSAWVLIALLIVVIIAVPILYLGGWLPQLAIMGDVFQGILFWASDSVLNGVLLLGGVFSFGMLTWYVLKKYIFGTQIPIAGTYAPIGQTINPTQSQKDEETVVTS